MGFSERSSFLYSWFQWEHETPHSILRVSKKRAISTFFWSAPNFRFFARVTREPNNCIRLKCIFLNNAPLFDKKLVHTTNNHLKRVVCTLSLLLLNVFSNFRDWCHFHVCSRLLSQRRPCSLEPHKRTKNWIWSVGSVRRNYSLGSNEKKHKTSISFRRKVLVLILFLEITTDPRRFQVLNLETPDSILGFVTPSITEYNTSASFFPSSAETARGKSHLLPTRVTCTASFPYSLIWESQFWKFENTHREELFNPYAAVLKTRAIRDVVDQEKSVGIAVVRSCHWAKALLSCSIPDLSPTSLVEQVHWIIPAASPSCLRCWSACSETKMCFARGTT